MDSSPMEQTAEAVLHACTRAGAAGARVELRRARFVEISFRDGKLEKAQASTKQQLTLDLFLEHRYGVHSTSHLSPRALEEFVSKAVALTKALEPDTLRSLPNASHYPQAPGPDLEIHDPALARAETPEWVELARTLESLAREEAQSRGLKPVSAQGSSYAEVSKKLLADTSGFVGRQKEAGAFMGSAVWLLDPEAPEKRRVGWWWEGTRSAARARDRARRRAIAACAVERGQAQMGARPGPSGEFPLVVENRSAGRLVSYLLGALSGRSLHQKRSYLGGKAGAKIASESLSLSDLPLLPGGFASRWFDGEGLAAGELPIIRAGVLLNYFCDTYYARALELPLTTGSHSNIVLPPSGKRDLEAIAAEVPRGLVVTGFLGGNFNSTTGDFSLGVQGRWVQEGRTRHAVEGMNMSGNFGELWNRLREVGSDAYSYSALRTPSLGFSRVMLSGK